VSASNEFDPYHRWLGIRSEEQPADHYRLLALARFEDEPEVIRDAAEQRIRHVRAYQLGGHRKVAQKILNELAAAEACLLDERKKAKYDEELGEEVTKENPLPVVERDITPSVPPITPSLARTATVHRRQLFAFSKRVSVFFRACRHRGLPGRWTSRVGFGAAVAGGCVLLCLTLWLVAQLRPNANDTETVVSEVPRPQPKAPTVNRDEDPRSTIPEDAKLIFLWPLSERTDAALWIDGEREVLPQTGETTISFPSSPDRHSVRIEREGFEPIEFPDFTLLEGETKTLALRWQRRPQEATLVFSWPVAERADAKLWIDGKAEALPKNGGTTIRFNLEAGVHSVKVERRGFEPMEVSGIQLSESESTIVPLRWRAVPQEATIALAWPLLERSSGALWIDGQPKSLPDNGDATLRFTVTPGTHSVRVERRGFAPIVFSNLTLVAAQSKTLSLQWQAIAAEPPLAVTPLDEVRARQHQKAWADYLGLDVEITNSIGMKMVLVPPGEFMLRRSDKGSANGPDNGRPAVSTAFYIGVHEVTQEQYKKITGKSPSEHRDAAQARRRHQVRGLDTRDFPVDSVSWTEAAVFCNQLSQLEGLPSYYRVERGTITALGGAGYRLPTMSEYLHAARLPSQPSQPVTRYAWLKENSDGRPHAVGTKEASVWSAYDLYGNIIELVWRPDASDSMMEEKRNLVFGGCFTHEKPGPFTIVWPRYRYHDGGFRVARQAPVEAP